MSKFFSSKYINVEPYVPGEQPQDRSYIKLNTNELPFPPSPLAQKLARIEAGNLNIYSDPNCNILRKTAADCYGISEDEIMFGNGSDEILNYIVMAYCDSETGLVVPNVTYSFYKSLAVLNQIEYREIPVGKDLTIDPADYYNVNGTVMIANPNAPTGIALTLKQIEGIVMNNPDNIVVIDEAYVDFGGETAMGLINKYENILVTRTMSKVNGLAGGRLGFVVGPKELISDLNALRNSTNPYNINRMTMMAAVGALTDREYMTNCINRIMKTREETVKSLKRLGFETTDSSSNFLFVRHPKYNGRKLYQDLKDRGILIRHFETELLREYNRITIGSDEDMKTVVATIRELLEEQQ